MHIAHQEAQCLCIRFRGCSDGVERQVGWFARRVPGVCVFSCSLREGQSRPSDHLRTHSFLQGVPGAYSEQASLLAYDSCTPSPFDQFEHAFEARFAWVLESLHSLPDL